MFSIVEQGDGAKALRVFTAVDSDENPIEWGIYDVDNLYIVNGLLKHDGWINTTIGSIGFTPVWHAKDAD